MSDKFDPVTAILGGWLFKAGNSFRYFGWSSNKNLALLGEAKEISLKPHDIAKIKKEITAGNIEFRYRPELIFGDNDEIDKLLRHHKAARLTDKFYKELMRGIK